MLLHKTLSVTLGTNIITNTAAANITSVATVIITILNFLSDIITILVITRVDSASRTVGNQEDKDKRHNEKDEHGSTASEQNKCNKADAQKTKQILQFTHDNHFQKRWSNK